MTVAVAIAIAAHEILAALIPGSAPQSPAREVVARAEVVRVVSRRIVPPSHVVVPPPRPALPQRITHRPRTQSGAHRAPAPRARPHRVAALAYTGRPVWDTGNGHGTTANFSADGSGEHGDGGQATTTDANSGEEPCGFVEFSDPHGSRYDASTGGFYVDIRMAVHFADGSQQSVILDYPWYYASESANPWSAQNLKDANFPTRFQAPPATKLAGESPLVQYVAQHSTTDGMTLLHDCQGATEQQP